MDKIKKIGEKTSAEELQKECHEIAELIMANSKDKNITYQDATNVYIFQKLAQLENRIDNLSVKFHRSGNLVVGTVK